MSHVLDRKYHYIIATPEQWTAESDFAKNVGKHFEDGVKILPYPKFSDFLKDIAFRKVPRFPPPPFFFLVRITCR
jgi:hypothetical protein